MSSSSRGRLLGIDALRGLNIAAMIVYHFCLVYYFHPTTPLTRAIHLVGSWVAPLFFYLSGAGIKFFFEKYPPSRLLKRGIFLFTVSFLISVFLKGHFYVDWNLIEDIGFAFIVMAVLACISPHKFWLAIAIYLICFGLFSWFNFTVQGIFPIFPMAIFPLAGYGYVRLCPVRRKGPIVTRSAAIALAISLGTLGLGLLSLIWTSGTHFEWYSDSLVKNGCFMGLFFIFAYVLGHWAFEGFLGRFMVLVGRTSLSVYYFQQALLTLLLKTRFQVVIVHPFASYLLLTAVVLVSVFMMLEAWSRFEFRGSLEWWMRKL